MERDIGVNGGMEPVAMVVSNQIHFDNDQFDRQCREIIENIKERFIDLAPLMIDDEQQDYLDHV
jgi:hypothetical protein